WNTVPPQNTPTANNLTAGTYFVTVNDANLCGATANVTITEPPVLTASISAQTNVSCNGGNNGSATVTASGGTGPYTYNWNTVPPQNTPTANNLTAGTYFVTVNDANLCGATANVTITEPSAITLNTSSTNSSCGLSDGTATVTPSGGTAPYIYQWDTNAGNQTTQTAVNLAAGAYSVTVTDAGGCAENTIANINDNTGPSASISSSTNVSCFSGNNGTATVTATGGTLPYTYLWTTTPAQTTDIANNLPAGNYSVTVTDNNTCKGTASVTITEPAVLTASISAQTNVSCNGGNNGSVTVTPGGGTPGYTYSWTGGQTTQIATNLTAGIYTVSVTDNNFCFITTSATITEPAALSSSVTKGDVTCAGGNNGFADLTISGGSIPYTYNWSNVATTEDITNLTAGSYFVTVSDVNSCVKTDSVTITEPALINTSIIPAPVSCGGGNNGSADLTASGGTPPYTYNWSNSATTEDISGLTAGIYDVTITDANGCFGVESAFINEPVTITGTDITTICQGDSVFVGGAWQSVGGNYYDIYTAANGCDSTVTTTLFVNSVYNGTANLTICEGDSAFFAGAWQTAAGDYTDVYTGANGCDSTIITTLFVNSVYNGTANLTICDGDSAFLAGAWQTVAGDYPDVYMGVNGCDSTIITTFFVNAVYNGTANVTICEGDSAFLAGAWQTAAGDYPDVYTGVNGCDSTIITTLFVNVVYNGTANLTICEGDSVFLGGAWQTTAGDYPDVYTGVNSCDSTIITTLFVNIIYNGTANLTICEGDSAFLASAWQTAAGDYTDVYTGANGCDSTIITTLFVNSVYDGTANQTICEGDSAFLADAWQNVAGNYTDVYTGVNGCDSTIITTRR
ncbi:MAG: SprB repeat-containing protein, partial [Bacteroidia bacterium]|nr:SprB repeat-containing protein [Bacteroidia bacterium]